MNNLQRKVHEFDERLTRAVKVERPDWLFTDVIAEGAVDLIFKTGEPGIQIVGDKLEDYSQVTFNFFGTTIFVDDRRSGSVDIIGDLVKPANLFKRFLRLFGIGSTISASKSPVLVCISQEKVPGLSHRGTGSVVAQNVKQDGLIFQLEDVVDVMASGEVQSLGVVLEGAGNVDVAALHATKALFAISGAGSIKGYARKSVLNTISGAGSIAVSGNPLTRSQKITGAGSVDYV